MATTSEIKEEPIAADNGINSIQQERAPENKCLKSGKMNTTIRYLLYGFGSVFLILGVALTGFWKPVYRQLLASQLPLTEKSQTKEMWLNGEVPIYFKAYLFNWTNPEECLTNHVKPNFVEHGPYTFRFNQLKSDLVWNKNHTITYKARRTWEFVPELSSGKMADLITNINVIAFTLGDQAQTLSAFDKIFVNGFLSYNEKTLYVTKTAEELLFEGYADKILDMGKVLKKYFKKLNFLTDKFGWYYGKNYTEVNYFNMYTGTDDVNNLGKVYSWNNNSLMNVYSGNCDRVRGSLGDLWPMSMADENIVSLFISDFCSALDLKNVGEKTVYDVDGAHFVGDKDTFDTEINSNTCYCPNEKCNIPTGVRNVSACLKAPIFVSFPHFYLADESYRSSITGMDPNPVNHTFSITLQQDSGVLLEIFARLQINVKVGPYPGLKFFESMPDVMVPTLWFEEYVDMPDNLKEQLRFNFNRVPNLLSASGIIFVIIGAILLVSGFILSRYTYTAVPYTMDNL